MMQSWLLELCPRNASLFSYISPTVFSHQLAAAEFTLPSPNVHDRFLMKSHISDTQHNRAYNVVIKGSVSFKNVGKDSNPHKTLMY